MITKGDPVLLSNIQRNGPKYDGALCPCVAFTPKASTQLHGVSTTSQAFLSAFGMNSDSFSIFPPNEEAYIKTPFTKIIIGDLSPLGKTGNY